MQRSNRDGLRCLETLSVTLLDSPPKASRLFPRAGLSLPFGTGRDGIALRVPDAGRGQALPAGWRPPLDGSPTDGLSPAGPAARHGYAIASSAGSDVLRRAITGIDGFLSHCCGVKPYSQDERCLLRYAAIPSPEAFRLSDGTELRRGDPVIDLHLWNEHIPPVPKAGPDLAWARLVAQWMRHSLALLADAVDVVPELQGAKAVRAKTNFVGWGGHNESMTRLIGRFGFEDIDEGSASLPERIHDAFENILIGALTWAHNPEALRRDKLIRQRRPVWMSVNGLRRRHPGR